MQRYVRLFGTPITLLVLLALLAYGGWWGKRNLLAPIPTAAPSPCVPQKVGSALTTSKVMVKVLNASSHVGLATQVGSQLGTAGFNVTSVGNAAQKSSATEVVGASASDPEVRLVQGFIKGAKVRADARPDHSVDVVLGSSYSGINTGAPRKVAVKGGTVCLPSARPSTGS